METGQIELLRPLGEGGFGEVWLAKLHGRDGFHRRVAVKLMKEANAAADIVARQRDEARLLGLLQHPNIVAVYDLTEHHGLPAVIMEYVEGVDVSSLVKLTGPLPVTAAILMASSVALALDAGWNSLAPDTGRPLRVVHRDIKPANVLITVHGTVKVLDFGVARADFDREGRTQSMAFGTPRFMAPEQFLGGEHGAGNDVYALGVTLWEAVMGVHWERPPLAEDRFVEKTRAQVERAPAVLQPLLSRMVSWEPHKRPTAAEVVVELERLPVEGEGLRAYAQRVVPDALARHSAALVERSSSGASFGPPVSLPTPLPDSGASLVTQSAPSSGMAPPRPPPPGPPLAVLAGAGALGLAGVLVLGMGALWLSFHGTTSDPTPDAGALAAAEAPPAAAPTAAELPPTPPAVEAPALPPAAPTTSARSPASPTAPSGPSAADLVAGLGSGEAAPEPARPRSTTAPKSTPAAPVVVVAAPTPPPPEPAAAPEPARTRELRVLADVIGARVFLDGSAVGNTPLALRTLGHGSHRIEVEVDGVLATRTVEIDANTPATLRYRSKEKKWVWE